VAARAASLLLLQGRQGLCGRSGSGRVW